MLSHLTSSQKEGAKTISGPVSILAGAGTGKTSTIVARTVYLMIEHKVKKENILVLTFTNKAAKEMKERVVDSLKGKSAPELLTFHSFCINLLKHDAASPYGDGRTNKFSLISESSQKTIVKKCVLNVAFHNDEKYLIKKELSYGMIDVFEIQDKVLLKRYKKDIEDEQDTRFQPIKSITNDLNFNKLNLLHVIDEGSDKKLEADLVDLKKLIKIQESRLEETKNKIQNLSKNELLSRYIYLLELESDIVPYHLENKDDENHIHIKIADFIGVIQNIQNYLISDIDSIPEIAMKIFKLSKELQKKKKQSGWLTESGFMKPTELFALASVFKCYKSSIRAQNLLDFEDLINLSIDSLINSNGLKNKFRARYKYLMVDEFQDTNSAQMKLLDLLINPEFNNICVVGDEAQSIYGWRGADIHNILSFSDLYENTKVINLNKNFRSTKSIVNYANNLIRESSERHKDKKDLKAVTSDKGRTWAKHFQTQEGEARYISTMIKNFLHMGDIPSEIAILYRTKMVLPSIEKELIKNRIPYKIVKGQELLKKNISASFLSMFDFIVNNRNHIALRNSLISSGVFTENKMNEIENVISVISLIKEPMNMLEFLNLNSKITSKLESYRREIRIIANSSNDELISMEKLISIIRSNISLIKTREDILLDNTKSEAVKNRAGNDLLNIDSLLDLMKDYDSIESFLEFLYLEPQKDDNISDSVQLMTMHNSKGLEFNTVFLPTFNEGILPLNRANKEESMMEEERRIAYVAITRAKRNLYVSFVSKMFGKRVKPSRFLKESKII